MAASIVCFKANSKNNGSDVNVVLGVEVEEDDIILVGGGFSGGTATAPDPLGPTGFASVIAAVNSAPIDYQVHWLRAGSTPPTSILMAGSGAATDSAAWCVVGVRGIVTTGNPFETVQTSTLSVGVPQAPSVITITDGAAVVAFGSIGFRDISVGTITNFSFHIDANTNDTDDITSASDTSIIADAGSIAPTTWTGWTASYDYSATTVALEPAVVASVAGAVKDMMGMGIIPFVRD